MFREFFQKCFDSKQTIRYLADCSAQFNFSVILLMGSVYFIVLCLFLVFILPWPELFSQKTIILLPGLYLISFSMLLVLPTLIGSIIWIGARLLAGCGEFPIPPKYIKPDDKYPKTFVAAFVAVMHWLPVLCSCLLLAVTQAYSQIALILVGFICLCVSIAYACMQLIITTAEAYNFSLRRAVCAIFLAFAGTAIIVCALGFQFYLMLWALGLFISFACLILQVIRELFFYHTKYRR